MIMLLILLFADKDCTGREAHNCSQATGLPHSPGNRETRRQGSLPADLARAANQALCRSMSRRSTTAVVMSSTDS